MWTQGLCQWMLLVFQGVVIPGQHRAPGVEPVGCLVEHFLHTGTLDGLQVMFLGASSVARKGKMPSVPGVQPGHDGPRVEAMNLSKKVDPLPAGVGDAHLDARGTSARQIVARM